MSPADITYVSQDGVRWALRQGVIHHLRPAVRQLLMCLASHADPSGYARPGNWILTAETGLEIRSIRRLLDELVKDGVLKERSYRQHGQTLKGYHLQLWRELSGVDCAELHAPPKRTLNPLTSDSQTDSESEKTDSESEKTDSESDKDSNEDSNKRERRVHAAPAAPTPPTRGCMEGEGPAERTEGVVEQTRPRLPRPGELVAAFNAVVDGTGLVTCQSEITQSLAVMLTKAIKHRALDGHIEAWRRYCTWATQDPFLSGERDGGYPANLRQLCKADVIDRWACAAKPRIGRYDRFVVDESYTPVAPEAHDPTRRWNAKTETWDYVMAVPFGPEGPTVEPGVLDIIQAALEEDWQEQGALLGQTASSTPLRRTKRGVG